MRLGGGEEERREKLLRHCVSLTALSVTGHLSSCRCWASATECGAPPDTKRVLRLACPRHPTHDWRAPQSWVGPEHNALIAEHKEDASLVQARKLLLGGGMEKARDVKAAAPKGLRPGEREGQVRCKRRRWGKVTEARDFSAEPE